MTPSKDADLQPSLLGRFDRATAARAILNINVATAAWAGVATR